MRLIIISLLSIILGFASWSAFAVSPDKTGHLFVIERSKNKSLVQYDIRLTENRDFPDSKPVIAYWILENGRREELNSIEREYAYGIVRQEKLARTSSRSFWLLLKVWRSSSKESTILLKQ